MALPFMDNNILIIKITKLDIIEWFHNNSNLFHNDIFINFKSVFIDDFNIFAKSNIEILVYKYKNKYVGFFSYTFAYQQINFIYICVADEFQKQGIGSELVGHLLDSTDYIDYPNIILTKCSEPAKRLFDSIRNKYTTFNWKPSVFSRDKNDWEPRLVL